MCICVIGTRKQALKAAYIIDVKYKCFSVAAACRVKNASARFTQMPHFYMLTMKQQAF